MKKLLLALALVPAVSFANSNGKLARIDAELKTCLSAEGGDSTAGMMGCYLEGNEKADALLNEVYQKALRELRRGGDEDSKEILARLRVAQRAWIPSRDADCLLEATSMLGGSGENVVIITCHYAKTVARVKFLEENVGVER